MADSFDPYHVWLGIPPEEQPPNHYRLLGIRSFEANADVIDNMADQRMTHLRTFQTGKNAKLSQKLLNEVAAARICLLNPKTKQDYDQRLRGTIAADPSASASTPRATGLAPPPPALPVAQPIVSGEVLRRVPAMSQAAPYPDFGAPAKFVKTPPPRKSLAGPLIAGGAALLTVIALGVGYALMNQNDQSPSHNGDPKIAQPIVPRDKDPADVKPARDRATMLVFNVSPADRAGVSLSIDSEPVPLPAGDVWEIPCRPGQHRVKATRQGFKPIEATVIATAGQRQAIDLKWHAVLALDSKPAIVKNPATTTTIKPIPSNVARQPVSPPPPKPVPPKTASSNDPSRQVAKPDKKPAKIAVPDEAALAKATKSVQDIYRDDFRQALTAEQKLELAKKLFADGLATADDPVGRFVLLKMARDMAATQGDLDTATQIVGKLAEQYEVDLLEMKCELLIAAAKMPLHPDDCTAKLNAFADEAVAADHFDLAKRTLTAALAIKVEPALRKQTAAHLRDVNETEVEFRRLKSSLDALKTNPDDPDANLAVGKFNCLAKGNFATGLPLLAKGSDKTLADLAKLDLAHSADQADQIKVADCWWDTGKKPARLRAKAIYESALASLSGMSRLRIEKRLQEFEAKTAVEGWTNLVRLIDPVKNAVRGQWTKEGDAVQCMVPAWGSAVMIPFDPSGNYEVKAEFTRLTGATDITVFLPVNGTHCRVTLGAAGRFGGGIDTIDGHDLQNNNPSARVAKLENNQRYQLDIAVRTNGVNTEILVRVNGNDFAGFRGQTTQLTGLPFGMTLPNPKWLALGAQSSTVVFHSVQLRKLAPPTGR